MISQVVAVLVIAHVFRRLGLPMQHPHTAAPGLHVDHLQHFAGAAVITQLQVRQITGFSNQCPGIGVGLADFTQAYAVGAVDIALTVIETRIAYHRPHFAQLVAQVPGQGLPRLQVEQVAVAVEASAEVVFTGLHAFQHRQATVAVRRRDQTMSMTLRTFVGQLQQITARIVVIGLAVIRAGRGIIKRGKLWTLIGAARFPTRGFNQLRQAVVGVAIDRFDPLVGEVANRLRDILDAQHVAHRVVGVVQVLQGFVAALRLEAGQSAILRVVFQRGDHVVAGDFPFGLAVGVVGDGADQSFRSGCAVELQADRAQLAVEGLTE
ncbi:hypothetical protein D9M71_410170 [compost metagenome]